MFGASFGWASPARSQLESDSNNFPVSPMEFGWIASILNLGSAVSCLLIGAVMERFGRKNAMLLFIIPIFLGWILVIFAQNFAMILLGRLLLGTGGAYFISCPQYTTEIADVNIRGTLGTFAQLFFTVGILFSYVIGALIPLFWMNVICGVLPLLFGLIFYLMPESPHYLFSKNDEVAAINSLKKLRGNRDLKEEIEAIKFEISNKQNEKVSVKKLFKDKATLKAGMISVGLVFFLQMSAINSVLFYTKSIFDVSRKFLRIIKF